LCPKPESRGPVAERAGTSTDRYAEVERVYRELGDLVLRRARSIMGNESDAQEILQELFMSLMHNPQQLEGKVATSGWLYAATTHLCLNTIRNRKNRARLLRLQPAPAPAQAATAESKLTALELLAQLPDELAQVAIYFYFDEMTHEEIAELVGCSRRHVGNLVLKVQERVGGHR
jgi:RNA polymerase sigma-70 factor (ECF subfamily)